MRRILMVLGCLLVIWCQGSGPAGGAPQDPVPPGHWAYDALAQLSANGILKGYPDGSVRGGILLSRFELAALVSRSLAHMDRERGNLQDLILVKQLEREFREEFRALEVRTEKLADRVSLLEDELGAWSFSGAFQYNLRTWAEDPLTGYPQFGMGDFYIWMKRRLDEKNTFTARLGHVFNEDTARWDYFWVDTALPDDWNLRTGRWYVNWEGDARLYTDNEAIIGDVPLQGMWLSKTFSWGDAALFVAHDEENPALYTYDKYIWGGRLNAQVSENLRAAVSAVYHRFEEEKRTSPFESDWLVVWGDVEVALGSGAFFRGVWYRETLRPEAFPQESAPEAWKAVLELPQGVLPYTSLWAEYVHMDRNFKTDQQPWNKYVFAVTGHLGWHPKDPERYPLDVLFLRAEQRWNDQWSTFQRYVRVHYRETGAKDLDTTNWTLGVRYRMGASVVFEPTYDHIDYGRDEDWYRDNESFSLRTTVYF